MAKKRTKAPAVGPTTRILHRARDGVMEFALTAGVCGVVLGAFMLARQFG